MNNLLSLLFGLVSWGMGIGAVARSHSRLLSAGSILLCALSLMLQLAEIHRLVQLGDWSALMDTMDAVLLAAAVLLAVTAGLNIAAAWKAGK